MTEINASLLSTQNLELSTDFTLSCPVPISDYPNVLLAHGSGGRLMHNLLEKLVLPAFNNPRLETRHDGAVIPFGDLRLAFTTDSYVVRPLFFPGGSIGTLAVNGTVNDLAMCGAKPLFLSAGFILEEGLPMETLWRVIQVMQQAAQAAGVQVVTGDTKVVDKGKGDGIFINTAGIGVIEHQLTIAPSSVRPGDAVLLNGDIGRHGMAIMAVREGLAFESEIESDCAPLAAVVQAVLDAGVRVHCLRDLTRGGLASGLVEIATGAGLHIHIDEKAVPVTENVRGACEILGLDPLYVANEGRFIAFVPAEQADYALEAMGEDARWIGTVQDDTTPSVTLRSTIGVTRIVDMLSGEQLPRIC
jgi:hydrogenase expression/formation protein HypE